MPSVGVSRTSNSVRNSAVVRVAKLKTDEVDIVLVEGFRHVAFPKIELNRPSLGKDLIFPHDENIIAVASDDFIETGDLTHLSLDDVDERAYFIKRWLHQQNEQISA